MPEFGFPAQPRQSLIRSLVADLRARSDEEREALITGRLSDPTRALNGRVNELLQIEKSIADLNDYADNIALSEGRASTMQNALSSMIQSAELISNQVNTLLTNGTDSNFRVISSQAQQELQSVVAALNVEYAGRSLFAGDDAGGSSIVEGDEILVNSVPFLEGQADADSAYSALQDEFLNAGGLYETTFYVGGAGEPPLTEVAPGERVNYGVKADETPFRDLTFNVAVLAASNDPTNAIPNDQRRELAELASAGLRNAISSLVETQGRLGTAEERIANAKARNIAAEATFSLSFNELSAADSFETTLSLTEIETQLETAFSTTARLARLSLANFI